MLHPSSDTKALLIHLFEILPENWHKAPAHWECDSVCGTCIDRGDCDGPDTLGEALGKALEQSEVNDILVVRGNDAAIYAYELLDHYIGDSWDHIPVNEAKEACIDMLKNGGTYICDCVACNWHGSEHDLQAEMESVRQQKADMLEWKRLRAIQGAYA